MLWGGLRYTVNIPKWDDWPITGSLLAAKVDGNFHPALLVGQVVDNRMPVSRIVFFGLALATGWNAHAITVTTWIFAMFALTGLYFLARKTWPKGKWRPWLVTLAGSILIFSPTDWMLWTFCPFMANTLLVACMVATLACATGGSPRGVALGMVFSLVASWTYLSGWLTWGVLVWLLLGYGWRGDLRGGRLWTLVALLCLLVIGSAALYFTGYQLESHSGLLGRLLSEPWKPVAFFLRWLGAPFGDHLSWWGNEAYQRTSALVIGALGSVAFLGLSVVAWREAGLRKRAWPWWGLGLWALGAGAMVTLGRFEMSEDAAFWPRYQLFAGLFWVALVALALLSRLNGARRVFLASGFLVVFVGIVPGSITGWDNMRADYLASLGVRAGIEMMEAAPSSFLLHQSWPGEHSLLEPMARKLSDAGFINPAIVKSTRVADAKVVEDPAVEGEITRGNTLPDNEVELSGWAWRRDQRRPVDAVVISCQYPGGEEHWFGLAGKFNSGGKMALKLGLRGKFTRIKWRFEPVPPGDPLKFADIAPIPTLLADNAIFRAYALDTRHLEFTRLKGELTLSRWTGHS